MRAKENAPARRGNAVRGETKGRRKASENIVPPRDLFIGLLLGGTVVFFTAGILWKALM